MVYPGDDKLSGIVEVNKTLIGRVRCGLLNIFNHPDNDAAILELSIEK